VLVFELLAEQLAWAAFSGPQTVVKISQKTPFFQHNSRVNLEFYDALIEKCLNYDYKERPSAARLLAELT